MVYIFITIASTQKTFYVEGWGVNFLSIGETFPEGPIYLLGALNGSTSADHTYCAVLKQPILFNM